MGEGEGAKGNSGSLESVGETIGGIDVDFAICGEQLFLCLDVVEKKNLNSGRDLFFSAGNG